MELPLPCTWLEYGYMLSFPCRKKRKREKGSSTGKTQFIYRVEKEYLKPSYSASVGEELEDGLFDGNVKTHLIIRNKFLCLLVTVIKEMPLKKPSHPVPKSVISFLFFTWLLCYHFKLSDSSFLRLQTFWSWHCSSA